MFTVSLVLLLFEMLVATAEIADQCCPSIQHSLTAMKSGVEALQDQLAYLHRNLQNQFHWPTIQNAFVRIDGDDYLSTEDFEAAMAEIKLKFQDLKDVTVGLRRKLEPEFNCPSSQKESCPSGFIYLPLAQSCYRVVYEAHTWTSADTRCRQLHKGARLAAITNQDESNALRSFLRLHFATNPASSVCEIPDIRHIGKLLWISGQSLDENSCIDPFVWKLSKDEQLPFAFTDWNAGEPNYGFDTGQCVHLATTWNYHWNDAPCNYRMCALCEYQPA